MKKKVIVLLMVVLCVGLVFSQLNEAYADKPVKLTL
jgi:hypothetical protein